jgi:hypothetical protein
LAKLSDDSSELNKPSGATNSDKPKPDNNNNNKNKNNNNNNNNNEKSSQKKVADSNSSEQQLSALTAAARRGKKGGAKANKKRLAAEQRLHKDFEERAAEEAAVLAAQRLALEADFKKRLESEVKAIRDKHTSPAFQARVEAEVAKRLLALDQRLKVAHAASKADRDAAKALADDAAAAVSGSMALVELSLDVKHAMPGDTVAVTVPRLLYCRFDVSHLPFCYAHALSSIVIKRASQATKIGSVFIKERAPQRRVITICNSTPMVKRQVVWNSKCLLNLAS